MVHPGMHAVKRQAVKKLSLGQKCLGWRAGWPGSTVRCIVRQGALRPMCKDLLHPRFAEGPRAGHFTSVSGGSLQEMEGPLKGVRKINNGTVSENATKGLFSQSQAGLREAVRDGEAQERSSMGTMPGVGAEGSYGTQQDL